MLWGVASNCPWRLGEPPLSFGIASGMQDFASLVGRQINDCRSSSQGLARDGVRAEWSAPNAAKHQQGWPTASQVGPSRVADLGAWSGSTRRHQPLRSRPRGPPSLPGAVALPLTVRPVALKWAVRSTVRSGRNGTRTSRTCRSSGSRYRRRLCLRVGGGVMSERLALSASNSVTFWTTASVYWNSILVEVSPSSCMYTFVVPWAVPWASRNPPLPSGGFIRREGGRTGHQAVISVNAYVTAVPSWTKTGMCSSGAGAASVVSPSWSSPVTVSVQRAQAGR